MSKEFKISIIIPVYNVEQYLDRCLSSVIHQSYRNLEIIVVEDGATDHSAQICDKYGAQDQRIQVIHKKNGGLSDARNVGIDRATGDFIGFVDADDYIHPRMYEYLVRGLLKYHADICVCNHFIEQGERLLIREPIEDYEIVYSTNKAMEKLIKNHEMKSYAWDKLYKSDLFRDVRYPKGRTFEDIATTYQLFAKANRVCHIPYYGYYYQKREDSISFHFSYQNWKDYEWAQEAQFRYLKMANEERLGQLVMAELLKSIFMCIRLSYQFGKRVDTKSWIEFLNQHHAEICQNPYLTGFEKKLIQVYKAPYPVLKIFLATKNVVKKARTVLIRGEHGLERIGVIQHRVFDFRLKNAKKIRLFFFELDCFDNLGDHAIAYAEEQYLHSLTKNNPDVQIFIISYEKARCAVNQLRREIQKTDIICCQGGGNMGNLYPFIEDFRRKILKTFRHNKIIIFPQTLYFTKDGAGNRQKRVFQRVYNKCSDLTVLARDGYSFQSMSALLQCRILPMVDSVTFLKSNLYQNVDRRKILLVLRSDQESVLSIKDKQLIREICETTGEEVQITDTVIYHEVKNRELELKRKWKLFGSAKLVVTDRLHGMIFAMYTQTSCIVIGNNHHKVKETYETLKECSYLHYVEGINQIKPLITELIRHPEQKQKMDFQKEYHKLDQIILKH